LDELKAMPSRTQITRHDCVEGWSCIGKWKGVPLGHILDQVQPKPEAKFVLFRCFDSMDGPSLDGRDSRYYESIDVSEARHAQTILAYDLNDKPLPVTNGAPLRCRVERQLGYKQAKYVRAIELVSGFADIRGGKGGYWEDEGYEWYGGI
ncbi:MAG: molybdopterin-dependent oxidoreductase, partial [Caldimonas sp.]